MTNFMHYITTLPTPFNMVVWIVLIGTVASVTTAIVKQLGAYAQQRQDLAFKRELIDRGMSADEVQRVVEARTPPASHAPTTVHANQYFAPEA
jgi:hypothetical protein